MVKESCFPEREKRTKSIPIREVKEVIEACYKKPEWDHLPDERQDEIVNHVTRILEIVHSNAEGHLAAMTIDFLKRCG